VSKRLAHLKARNTAKKAAAPGKPKPAAPAALAPARGQARIARGHQENAHG